MKEDVLEQDRRGRVPAGFQSPSAEACFFAEGGEEPERLLISRVRGEMEALPERERRALFTYAREGLTVGGVAGEYGVCDRTVYRWRKQAAGKVSEGVAGRDLGEGQ